MEKKLTKKEILTAIKNHVLTSKDVDGVPVDVVVEFVDTTIAQIDAKAEKAKENAAKKKADGDALREEVFSHITSEWQTADAITELVVAEDISKAKVVARLTQLVKAGMVEKEQQKIGDAKLMCYRVVSAE